jgi:hypothetical protein
MTPFVIRSLPIVWIASLRSQGRRALFNVAKPSGKLRHFSFFPVHGMGSYNDALHYSLIVSLLDCFAAARKDGAHRPCERSEAIQQTTKQSGNALLISRQFLIYFVCLIHT